MKLVKERIASASKLLAGSWITWVVLGAAAGTGVLLGPGT